MKLFNCALFIFISIFGFSQDEKEFSSLDSKSVMARLFDKVTFNVQQEALWKPNYSERINMPVSDDGFCHTIVDTVMFYDSNEAKYAVFIFSTYEYINGEKSSCHACSPTLSIATFEKGKGKAWQISQFKKEFIHFGSWGKRTGYLGVEKLGDDFYCIKVKSAIDGNQGYETGISRFYSLNWDEQFNEIFSFIYFDSDEGATVSHRRFLRETKLTIIPTQEKYHLIELTTKRSDSKFIEKRKFRYSDDDGRYLLIN